MIKFGATRWLTFHRKTTLSLLLLSCAGTIVYLLNGLGMSWNKPFMSLGSQAGPSVNKVLNFKVLENYPLEKPEQASVEGISTLPSCTNDQHPLTERVVTNGSNLLNLNTASEAELMAHLPGVGKQRAAAIVTYRNEHGRFLAVDELLAISGIGPKQLALYRTLLTV